MPIAGRRVLRIPEWILKARTSSSGRNCVLLGGCVRARGRAVDNRRRGSYELLRWKAGKESQESRWKLLGQFNMVYMRSHVDKLWLVSPVRSVEIIEEAAY